MATRRERKLQADALREAAGGGTTRRLRKSRGGDSAVARIKADSRESMMSRVDQLRKFRESEAAARQDAYGLTRKDYLADDDPRLRNRERVSAYARHFRR